MTPDRILLLNRWFAPETFGGTETTIRDLGQTFRDMGVDVSVVCETRSLPTGWSIENDLRVFRHPGREVPEFAWSLRPAAAYWNIVRWLRILAPQISGRPIIARTPAYAAAARQVFPGAWITYWAPGSRPSFQLFEGKDDLSWRERGWEWFHKTQNSAVRRRAMRGANIVVAEAQHVADDLVGRMKIDAAKVRTRGNGVDLARFRPRAYDAELAAELRIPAGTPIVLGASRFEPLKNLVLLVRAFARMTSPNAVLVLVGDGSEAPVLRALVNELGIADRVRFAGWRHDIERFYALADVYVLPSISEAYGNCYAEALATGTPTIGVRPADDIFVASQEHVVEDENGFLVDARDPGELSVTLDRILSSRDLRERLALNARTMARRRYCWQTTATQFLQDIPVN